MKPILRMTGRRLRILNLHLKRLPVEVAGDDAVVTRPSPSGVFAALLVEWKQAQIHDVADEMATPKSA